MLPCSESPPPTPPTVQEPSVGPSHPQSLYLFIPISRLSPPVPFPYSFAVYIQPYHLWFFNPIFPFWPGNEYSFLEFPHHAFMSTALPTITY
jgi:hypothetical protein